MGLSAALSIAGSSLDVFTAGMQVAGQNIANANTPGYIREQLNVAASVPYVKGGIVLGTGVTAQGVKQDIDKYLQLQIYAAQGDYQGANAASSTYQSLQSMLNSLGSGSLSDSLGSFINTLNTVANQPELQSSSQLAVAQGQQLVQAITTVRGQVDTMRTAQNTQVTNLVAQANSLIDQINKLNPQIVSAEAAGLNLNDAGGLRDQRYQALTQLAQLIPIKVDELPTGEDQVTMGSDFLVQGDQVRHLETYNVVDRGVQVNKVRVQTTNTVLTGTQGQINGVMNGRDQVLGGFVDQLDQYTGNIINQFNQIFASGQGAAGFTSVTSTNAVTDPTASLNTAGLPFTPTNGSFKVNVTNIATGATTTTTIPVDLDGIGSDTTLNSLAASLNAAGNITATVTPDGHLSLSAASGYQLKFSSDTSGALADLGINTFFTGSNSGNIGVNQTVVNNPSLFATGQGGGASDGSNALALAQFADQPSTALGGSSINTFYNTTITKLGQNAASQSALASGSNGYLTTLTNQQQQTSGVSLDEEAINVMTYQHAYQATARYITTVDQMLNALMQI
ncbi:MAG TPA: flagellar hook-associated protein FlgK [Candidatus Saccharimonadales bacterium]|nr:flagellar hook-associated protein FlgK [Candidatus Saccharimonadales bacterium]